MAHISAANKVLPKLAPRIVMKASPINAFLSVHLGANVDIKQEATWLMAQLKEYVSAVL